MKATLDTSNLEAVDGWLEDAAEIVMHGAAGTAACPAPVDLDVMHDIIEARGETPDCFDASDYATGMSEAYFVGAWAVTVDRDPASGRVSDIQSIIDAERFYDGDPDEE